MKKGLGRGLDSLFSIYDKDDDKTEDSQQQQTKEVEKPVSQSKSADGIQEIAIDKVYANINQPRKHFNEEALNELSESIKNHGVIQPIIVAPKDPGYMVIAGERRWRAAKMAGVSTIPALIKDYTNKQIKEVSIIENLQREDLNPIEAATAIKELMDEYGWTQDIVAKRLGKSRSVIANTLRLLQLEPEVIDLIKGGKLSAGHARSLVVVNNKQAQIKLAKLACDKKITVRDLENAVKKQTGKATKSKEVKQQSEELKKLISDMQRVFSTKVSALGTNSRGRIYIDYYTEDDLERIFDLVEALKSN